MKRGLAAFVAVLVAAPAGAQDPPGWVGVWEGTVGRSPVRLCIDGLGDGPARGSYYYLSQLEPIALSEEDGEGGWIERAPGDEGEAHWNFAEQSAAALRGQWRRLRVTHPFALRPVPWAEGDWGGPCSSAEFVAPLLAGGEVADTAASFDGWAYTEHRYRPPAHLDGDVMVATFTYPDREPGDGVINAMLRAYLPRGNLGDGAYDCLAGALSSLGTDGYVDQTVRPMLVSRVFLGFDEANDQYCGGNHPNAWQVMRVFDRQSGKEVDLFDWIGAPREDGEESILPEALLAAVLARWPADAEPDCREIVGEGRTWMLGLARDGLVFQPDLPHIAMACAERVTVGWQELAPFLDAEGRAGLAQLRGG
jgi:hypothetical protein